MKNFEKDMDVFSYHQHQEFITYMKVLSRKGYTVDDVRKYIEKKAFERLPPDILESDALGIALPDCPECHGVMVIRILGACKTVNSKERTILLCTKCKYHCLSEKTIKEWLEV